MPKRLRPPETGDAIERLALRTGLGFNDIAAIIGVNKTTLWRYRNGGSLPTPDALRSLHRLAVITGWADEFGDTFNLRG